MLSYVAKYENHHHIEKEKEKQQSYVPFRHKHQVHASSLEPVSQQIFCIGGTVNEK